MNQKRREQIEEMLQKQKTVTNAELMERFAISIETVRRDLAYLEKKGVIERVYGGAVRKEVAREEPLYVSREEKNSVEKQAIAAAAEALIADRDIVFFDLGTTVQMVAGKLAENKKIHAFTNAIRTAVTLSEKNCEVILPGGSLRRGELSLAGSLAENNLQHFNIGKAIIGAAGITEEGVSDFIADEAGLRSKVIAGADKVIVLADFEKFGVRAMCKVCSLDSVDVLITDEKAPKDMLKMLKKKGIQIIVAKI